MYFWLLTLIKFVITRRVKQRIYFFYFISQTAKKKKKKISAWLKYLYDNNWKFHLFWVRLIPSLTDVFFKGGNIQEKS